MRLSKKTKYVLIGLLVILNIILRLPVIPYEIGMDFFNIHELANSVWENKTHSIVNNAKIWRKIFDNCIYTTRFESDV